MKATLTIQILLGGGLILSAIGMAVENPNVSTSFNSNTNVPSQGQGQRLLTRPNPLGASSNDVVTGNVGGLRYFHGVVPYGSSYYSGSNLGDSGSGDVSDFLRRSTNPVLSDRNPGQSRAFYDPQRTTSSFYVRNGKKTDLSTAIAQNERNPYAQPALPQILSSSDLQRPLSTNSHELEQILSRQAQLKETAKKNLLVEDKTKFKDFFETILKPEELKKLNQELITEQEQKTPVKPELETLEQFRKEQEKLNLEQKPVVKDSQKETDEEKTTEKEKSPIKRVSHAEAERILGEHKTFAELAEMKFSDYMKTAEEFIRDGKFYKAADAYSLAGVWMPNDARPWAGQAFALFAAGEYMSSAFYLSRAIEIDSALAAKKYDLPGLIGDRDVFENRLLEMTTWQQRSDSGELAFLMAYVLYHDGKTAQAAEAIGKAQAKMPDSAAVAILKKVIVPENENTTSP